jgi:hypothetical protein
MSQDMQSVHWSNYGKYSMDKFLECENHNINKWGYKNFTGERCSKVLLFQSKEIYDVL